jgi:hypothetical protein
MTRRLDPIQVTGLAREDAAAALGHLRETLTAHHGVAIDAPVVEAAVARSLPLRCHSCVANRNHLRRRIVVNWPAVRAVLYGFRSAGARAQPE